MTYKSTKLLTLGSCAFRQPNAAIGRQDAGKNSSRCSKIHGYRLKAKFWFGCSELDDRNWVQDFGGFGPIKELFEHQFDHTTCLDAKDPLLPLFQEIEKQGGLDLRIMPDGTGIEKIAKFCFDNMQDFVHKQSNGRVWVEQVECFEHVDNSAIYTPSKASTELETPVAPQETITVNYSPPSPPAKLGANVGSNVTPGKGNWFSGTTWG
jgi:6-pyruvoyl-tetrahydropterin synthase